MNVTDVKHLQSKSMPEKWVEERLGDLVFYEKGKRPKTLSKQQNNEYKYPYVNIRGFEYKMFDEYSDGKSGVMCSEDDFLLVWDGARSGLVGKGIQGLVGSTLVKINFPGIYNDYAYYYLKSKYYEINTNAKGTGIPHVNPDLLWNYRFPIPPLPEQYRIVEKIEELFSEIDKGIEYLQTAKEQLMVYRQAVLKSTFEGKLTKVAKRNGWETCTLNDFALEIRTGPFGTLLHASDYITDGVPVINPKNIINQKIEPDIRVSISRDKAKSLERYRFKENDIVLGRRGEMGRVAYITQRESGWICGTGSLIVRLNNKDLSKLYSFYFSSKKVKNFLLSNSTGTTMNNLNEKIAKTIPVPVIPPEEQQKVLDEIESRLSVCEHMKETIEKGLKHAESLKQSILKKAFEGRLVPQDPDDEPATVLLERIRKEKNKREEALEATANKTKKGKRKHE